MCILILYAAASLIFIVIGIDLYLSMKKYIPIVAKASKGYLIALSILSSIYLFLRTVFLALSDIGKVVDETNFTANSSNWPALVAL